MIEAPRLTLRMSARSSASDSAPLVAWKPAGIRIVMTDIVRAPELRFAAVYSGVSQGPDYCGQGRRTMRNSCSAARKAASEKGMKVLQRLLLTVAEAADEKGHAKHQQDV